MIDVQFVVDCVQGWFVRIQYQIGFGQVGVVFGLKEFDVDCFLVEFEFFVVFVFEIGQVDIEV